MNGFILASGSPRRKDLLSSAGLEFTVIPSTEEEKVEKGLSPEETVKALALTKAKSVYKNNFAPTLGADTVVVFNGEILGKPTSKENAINTLKSLSGKVHYVMTGLALVTEEKTVNEVVITKVIMNELSDEFILNYVESGRAMDKAGSYGIQDGGFAKEIDGSYTNVMGLPMEKTEEILKEFSLWQKKI